MMRRIITLCMVIAFAALPLVASAQQGSEGYLIPKDAEPSQPYYSTPTAPSNPVVDPEQDRKLIEQAQMALRDAGFDPGNIDGVMGHKTQAALLEFQRSHDLPQSGRLDATTQQQLLTKRMPESNGQR
jgi:peptidoglycan hydrolase-like protein with peptidoglycan-binding domain